MHKEYIDEYIGKKTKNEIARCVYITMPTHAFIGKEKIEFEILDRVSRKFVVDINKIFICGSAQTKHSFVKGTTFKAGSSDLDIAIVDPGLFEFFTRISYIRSKNLEDVTRFGREDNTLNRFKNKLSRGNFRPDLMPSCREKTEWFNFFEKLTQDYIQEFSKISAGIYLSNYFYEIKQIESFQKKDGIGL